MEYQPTIGLEIHVELKTDTKMFCDCASDPDERHANVNVCPVCLGHPGTLPTANKKAIESVIRVGLALGGTISPVTKFDRKNYFYPDLPKGYQISQYDLPLVSGGTLCGVRIHRIHLEEDVARLSHGDGSATLVDYNRASVPLMELVTEPDVRSADQAANFARELQLLLRYLKVSDADMEKGQMRIEPNVSLNMGTKAELKNINSFKAVHDGIEYEIVRQKTALETGETLRQETRGWDEMKKKTIHQRYKESAHDYRYFPEPDLPSFETAVFGLNALRSELPELPDAKRERFAKEYGLPEATISVLIAEPVWADFFEAAASELREKIAHVSFVALSNYLLTDAKGFLTQRELSFSDWRVTPEHFAHLIALLEQKTIMSRQAKDLLPLMHDESADPEELLITHNFKTISDEGELQKIVADIIAQNPKVVADYRGGKVAVLQFLIGRAMGVLKGRGNPEILRQLFIDAL